MSEEEGQEQPTWSRDAAGYGDNEHDDEFEDVAQNVMTSLLTMFTSFHNADPKAFKSVVDEKARFIRTAMDSEGGGDSQEFPFSYFVNVLTKAEPGAFDERFDDPLVQIRDNMAHVWCRYIFKVKGEEKHRGYKSIQLRRETSGERAGTWIIVSVMDTIDRDDEEDESRTGESSPASAAAAAAGGQ